MQEMEKNVIADYLRASDPELEFNPAKLSLTDMIDLLIDRASEIELDYSILSTAFVNKVNPEKFEDFHDAVMSQYDSISDGEEIPESTLDRIAASYK